MSVDRQGVWELQMPGASAFAPFNAFDMKQRYRYEDGVLEETVDLVKRAGDGTATPFAWIEERAQLFAERRFDKAPSTAN